MPYEIICPVCGRELRVSDEAAGHNVQCPACQSILVAPEPPERGPLSGVVEILVEEAAYQRSKPPKPEHQQPSRPPRTTVRRRKPKKTPERYRYGEVELSGLDWALAILCGCLACVVAIVWLIQDNPKGTKLLVATIVVNVVLSAAGLALGMLILFVLGMSR
jgi:DNA-directed RNA polymerase subunit RPC12/RpoP